MTSNSLNDLINDFNRCDDIKNKTCPKCGCQCLDPFQGKKVIHDVEKCTGRFIIKTKGENNG
jgi:hypothetical protein